MGVLSDFFVASSNQLSKVFPQWLPVADEPSISEAVNPFTGEIISGEEQINKNWLPAIDPPKHIDTNFLVPNYDHFPHAKFRQIDILNLAQLNAILTDCHYLDKLDELTRPILIDPRLSDETGLHRLNDEFVTALAEITGSDGIAELWAETEEMQLAQFTADDCELVIDKLVELAHKANDSGNNLYYWWSL